MWGGSWKTWLHSLPFETAATPHTNLNDIRLTILEALADCNGSAAERVRAQVRSTRSRSDLLVLRGDIYQLVACEHCEAEARRRVNDLLPLFKEWFPASALARF